MNVAFEFLDEEQIENIITSLNYQFDKVVLIGYTAVVRQKKKQTKDFLTSVCGVGEVVFFQMKENDLAGVTAWIREEVRAEKKRGNKVFFDATGGEPLLMLAFGLLAAELSVPIHTYDVEKGKLHLLNHKDGASVDNLVPKRKIKLDIDRYIAMQGGVVAARRKRRDFPEIDIREIEDESFRQMIPAIWSVVEDHAPFWTRFSEFLRAIRGEGDALSRRVTTDTALSAIEKIREKDRSFTARVARGIFEACHQKGLFSEYRWSPEKKILSFTYQSAAMKKCLHDAGSILELYVGTQQAKTGDDCRVGVRIDWDGVLHDEPEKDVENEIDVLVLRGYVLSFISCKIGRVDKTAMYELETVAARFGGKYARRILAAPRPLSPAEELRALEMGIEVMRP